MVDETDSHTPSKSSEKVSQSDSKVIVSAKRGVELLEEDCNFSRKHAKMQNHQTSIQFEGIDTHDPENCKLEESEEQMDIIETQSSQVLDKNAVENVDTRCSERDKLSTSWVEHSGSKTLDLNGEARLCDNPGYNDSIGNTRKHAKGKAIYDNNKSVSGTYVDLDAEDVASSANLDPFSYYKSPKQLKKRDTSECGKNNQLEEKDALKRWKEIKENGFLSSSYGGIPAAPKPRGRKSKSDVQKQKMEQAKKEQVDKFTKIAAPSGLLNGLNPGIINHVRNRKQVHSIMRALVRSKKQESRRQANELARRESTETHMEHEKRGVPWISGSVPPCEVAAFGSMPQGKLLAENPFLHNNMSLFNSGDRGECRNLTVEKGTLSAKPYAASDAKNGCDGNVLALKFSSSSKASENTSGLSMEDVANIDSVDDLSVRAASVASQWLHLLQQDIKGRLGALRRSKQRVRAVITTELHFLLSKEFSSNQENDPCVAKDSVLDCSSKVTAEIHQALWSKLFHQMDTTLSEEETHLESWLNQVNKMLLHCDEGLHHVQWNTILEMQRLGAFTSGLRSKINDPEKDLSVRAAAASIYSTCSFLSSRENVSCC